MYESCFDEKAKCAVSGLLLTSKAFPKTRVLPSCSRIAIRRACLELRHYLLWGCLSGYTTNPKSKASIDLVILTLRSKSYEKTRFSTIRFNWSWM